MARTRYTVTFEHGDEPGQWIASVAGLQGCHTFGRGLVQTRRRIREALALRIGPSAARVPIEEVLPLPDPARRELAELEMLAREAEQLAAVQAELTRKRRRLARHLVERRGWSLRDVGSLLGLSFQRIEQLVAAR